MKRFIVIVAAALAGCQPGRTSERADVGKRPPAMAAHAESGGRFLARGQSGDERELKLQRFTVDVTPRPGTVLSHLGMEVSSPGDGQAEAIIRLAVPVGAAVTDAVLWVNGKPMRGAFVERQRASAVYSSIVTRRRDPALVTWDGPGWIGVSIYPLEHGEPRRFELEWVEPAAVAGGRVQYRVPIVSNGDRLVGRAVIKIDGQRVHGDGQDLVAIAPADRHKVFTRRVPGDPFQQVMVPEGAAAGAPHFVVVAETSAAMTRADRRRQHAALDGLFEELPPGAKATILAADWDVTPVAEDAVASGWPDALAKIDAIPSAGSLHLERALREAATRARKSGAAAVLFVGRGLDGFNGDAVASPLAELRDARVSLSAIEVGPGEVPHPLAQAAVETGGEAISARTFDDALATLVDALRPRPDRPGLDARGDGEWHVLRTVLGGAVWIGRVLDDEPAAGDEMTRAEAGSPLAADLASLWDRARLEWQDRDAGDEVARVVTPVTSLLVLESDADYRRFGLDVPDPVEVALGAKHRGEEAKMGQMGRRREGIYGLRGPSDNSNPQLAASLAEEQARNAGVLGTLKQTDGSRVAPVLGQGAALGNDANDVLGGLVGNQIGSAYGVGGLGLAGTGTAGGGTGEGTVGLGNLGTIGKGGGGGNGSSYGRGAGGLGGKRAKAPDVIPGQANVRGNLDKEIIRRIIRRHINEVRYCYEQELATKPALGGRVLVQFTIAASGEVIASVLQNSTLGAPRVDNCIVQAVKRWEFPVPLGGGIVIVSYPFVLTPRGGEVEDRAAGPAPSVEPAMRPIDQALVTLKEGSDPTRIEKISSLLRLRRLSSAEVLAWTIDRRAGDLETHLLVARLLEVTKHHRDAVRVLSESAAVAPKDVAAELRRIDADPDAAEVGRLATRR
jgi:TonB family protein